MNALNNAINRLNAALTFTSKYTVHDAEREVSEVAPNINIEWHPIGAGSSYMSAGLAATMSTADVAKFIRALNKAKWRGAYGPKGGRTDGRWLTNSTYSPGYAHGFIPLVFIEKPKQGSETVTLLLQVKRLNNTASRLTAAGMKQGGFGGRKYRKRTKLDTKWGHTPLHKVKVPSEVDIPTDIKSQYDALAVEFINKAKNDEKVRDTEKKLQAIEKKYPDFFAHYHHATQYFSWSSDKKYKHKNSDLHNYGYDIPKSTWIAARKYFDV